MKSDDIEVMGATAEILTYPPYWKRVSPPIEEPELEKFLFAYYERCLNENPQGEWSSTRYGVGQEIVYWFHAVPDSENIYEQTLLVHMKEWLAKVYLAGDADLREAILAGVLEHIFEEERWISFFENWKNDVILCEVYDVAVELGRRFREGK